MQPAPGAINPFQATARTEIDLVFQGLSSLNLSDKEPELPSPLKASEYAQEIAAQYTSLQNLLENNIAHTADDALFLSQVLMALIEFGDDAVGSLFDNWRQVPHQADLIAKFLFWKQGFNGPIRYLKEQHALYLQVVDFKISAALILHENAPPDLFKPEATFDPETKTIRLSLKQFQFIQEALRTHFFSLAALAWNEKLEQALLKVICPLALGKKGLLPPFPIDPVCFHVDEININQTTPYNRPIANGVSFIFHHLNNFQKLNDEDIITKDNYKPLEELKKLYAAGAGSFIHECIIRSVNEFDFLGLKLTLSAKRSSEDPFALKLVKNQYTQFLIQHPDKIRSLVDEAKQTLFVKMAVKAWAIPEEVSEICWLPESVLSSILQKQTPRFPSEQQLNPETIAVVKDVHEILFCSRVEEIDLNTIAKLSQCEKEEIASLLRLKILEMLLIMNQSVNAIIAEGIGLEIQKVPDLHLFPLTEKSLFHWVDNDFDRFEASSIFDILLPAIDYKNFFIPEYFKKDKFRIAQAETVVAIPSLRKENHAKGLNLPQVIPMKSIRYHWKAPLAFVEYFAMRSNLKPAKANWPKIFSGTKKS